MWAGIEPSFQIARCGPSLHHERYRRTPCPKHHLAQTLRIPFASSEPITTPVRLSPALGQRSTCAGNAFASTAQNLFACRRCQIRHEVRAACLRTAQQCGAGAKKHPVDVCHEHCGTARVVGAEGSLSHHIQRLISSAIEIRPTVAGHALQTLRRAIHMRAGNSLSSLLSGILVHSRVAKMQTSW